MTDERRATRHEPVVVDVETTDGKQASFTANPLPWRKRNDLGDAVMQTFTNALNSLAREMQDESGAVTGIESSLFDASMDYHGLFLLGYTTYEIDDKTGDLVPNQPAAKVMGQFNMLEFDGMIDVLVAALKANGLERLEHMLDPDRKKDQTTGESEPPTVETTEDGEKTASATDSGSLSQGGQDPESID